MLLMFIFYVLSFPNFENEYPFNRWNNFRNITRIIIVCLCLINLHLYYFNLYY